MLAEVPDLAINASLAASAVVLRPAGAFILLPALAVAAAAFKLLLVAKNMVELSSQLKGLSLDDVDGAHQHLTCGVHHFHVILVRAGRSHHLDHFGHLVDVGQVHITIFVGHGVARV